MCLLTAQSLWAVKKHIFNQTDGLGVIVIFGVFWNVFSKMAKKLQKHYNYWTVGPIELIFSP